MSHKKVVYVDAMGQIEDLALSDELFMRRILAPMVGVLRQQLMMQSLGSDVIRYHLRVTLAGYTEADLQLLESLVKENDRSN